MTRAGVALVAANAFFGSLAATTTIALRGFGPLTLLAGELLVAVLVLGAATVATGQRLPAPSVPLIGLGLLQPGAAFLTFDYGVQHTSSSHAGMLLSLETVFVVGLSIVVLRERPAPVALGGVGVAVAGVVLLALGGGGRATLLGDGLVLVDTAVSATSVIVTIRLVRDVAPLALTTAQFLIGWVAVLPLTVTAWVTGAERPFGDHPWPTPLLGLLGAGAIGTAGAFLIYNGALSRVTATTAGASATLIPAFALAFSVLIVGEPLTGTSLICVTLIIAGLLVFGMSQCTGPTTTPPAARARHACRTESG